MTLDYTILDPTGNITILVDPGVPEELQAGISAKLLSAEPAAEQVGFIMPADDCSIAVRMGGGEFCGNATLSAAALYCSRNGVSGSVKVRMSGCGDILDAEISRSGDGFYGSVVMPPPLSARRVKLPCGGSSRELTLVDFGGIAHLVDVSPAEDIPVSREFMRSWCSLLNAGALGLMRFDAVGSSMEPAVYVRDIDTLYYERSCASGTAALGAVLAANAGCEISACISEPGGRLSVTARPDGYIRLSGSIIITHSKSINI